MPERSAPATDTRIVAWRNVVKASRTLTLAQTEVFADTDGRERFVALRTAPMMTVESRDGFSD